MDLRPLRSVSEVPAYYVQGLSAVRRFRPSDSGYRWALAGSETAQPSDMRAHPLLTSEKRFRDWERSIFAQGDTSPVCCRASESDWRFALGTQSMEQACQPARRQGSPPRRSSESAARGVRSSDRSW